MNRIAILGGGIGGLCTAIALRRLGLTARVYEASPVLRAAGAGLWIPANAMQVLERLGLAEAVSRKGIPLSHADVLDYTGARLSGASFGWTKEHFGHTTIAIHRGRLQQVLLRQMLPETVHLGKACSQIEQTGDHLRITFRDGTAEEADVVIGADGIHSAVRGSLFPEARLRYSGQTSYRAVCRTHLPDEWKNKACEVWGKGVRFGFSPIKPGEVYWFAAVDAPAGEAESPDEMLHRLTGLSADFPMPIPSFVRHTDASELVRTDLFDLRPLASWWKGRAVLLGDAAHATTPNLGQGGAQAVEDAYVLADCLARHDTPEAAFQAYQDIRAPKANRIVATSYWLGKVAHLRNPVLRTLRNTVIRSTPESVNRKQFEALFTLNY